MFEYKDISQLHIELTNRCNAACPMCVRFYQNSPLVRPDIELGEITADQFKNWFPSNFLKQIDLILFCGVHGDPCVAKDLLEIVEYITTSSPTTKLRFNTNGGMRNPEFWTALGNMLKNWNEHWITFSIDGLEDTNHLYRRNVQWNKLISNVKAFTETGAVAHWDFLIFKHNEHQIDQAESLAIDLNFKRFTPKKALGVDNGSSLKPMVALNKEGSVDYLIYPPTNPKDRNLETPSGNVAEPESYPFTKESYQHLKETKLELQYHENRYKNFYEKYETEITTADDEYSRSDIQCKSKVTTGVELFIDNHGKVWPCCYIGTHMNSLYSDIATLQLHYEFKNYGLEHFDLHNYSLKEILDNGVLNKSTADTWKKDSIATGKLKYCLDVCGKCSSIDKIYTHDRERSL